MSAIYPHIWQKTEWNNDMALDEKKRAALDKVFKTNGHDVDADFWRSSSTADDAAAYNAEIDRAISEAERSNRFENERNRQRRIDFLNAARVDIPDPYVSGLTDEKRAALDKVFGFSAAARKKNARQDGIQAPVTETPEISIPTSSLFSPEFTGNNDRTESDVVPDRREAASLPSQKTVLPGPVGYVDMRDVLNPPAVRSGVLLNNGGDAVPQPGDMTLPSGSILRKSDADADRYFREQVLPAIERVQETADARAESAFEEASKQRNQRWISGFNIDPVGDFVADAVEQIATDRRERGPARIVKDVMDQLDPQQVNAYVADRVSEDPEFAAAAERLRQLLPDTDTSVNDEEIEQILASMTPAQRQQFDRDVVEEQKRISEESAAFQKAADAAWARQSNRFQQDMTDRLIAEMARRNMPENEWQAFLRTAYNASIPGLLTELSVGNRVGEDQALHSRIMQLAMERYDPSLLSRAAGEVVGLLSAGPLFSAGGTLGRAGAAGIRRLAERSVLKKLASRGVTQGAEGIARRLVAGNAANRLAQAAITSGTALGTYDAIATPLALSAAGENPGAGDVLGAAGRGFVTGALLPGISMATGRVANAASSGLGRYAAEAAGFAAENAAFVGMGTLYDGIRTGEWASPEQLTDDFIHSAGVLGMMKSVGALKRGRSHKPGFYDKVLSETEFTPEEVESLNRAGVDGRSYKRALFDMLNARDTAAGREVAERAAGQINSKYIEIMRSPEVPVSAKAKLMYLTTGRIPAHVPLVTDAVRTTGEDGRVTVDLLDPAGNLVQRRTFSSERAADAFERESAGLRDINSILYNEEVISRIQAENGRSEDIPGMIAEGIEIKYDLPKGGLGRAVASREKDRTPVQREAVSEYAARLKEIVRRNADGQTAGPGAARSTPEQQAERRMMEIAERSIGQVKNLDDDVVYTATMKDGNEVNIIKGSNLTYDPETGEVNADASDPTVVVRYADGTMRQVATREIDMILESVRADDALNMAQSAVREQLDAQIREIVELKDGRLGVIEAYNEDGSYNVAVMDADGNISVERFAEGDIVVPVAPKNEDVSVGSGESAETDRTSNEMPVSIAEDGAANDMTTVDSTNIPRLKNGQPDYNAMPAEMLAVEMSAALGHDKAVERIQSARAVNARNADKLEKSLTSMGDLNKAMAAEQRLAFMRKEDERLTAALEQLGVTEEPTDVKKPAENFSREIDRLFPDGLPNVRARILADIARGQRFVWSDTTDGAKRGVATELGFSGNESERRARFGILGSETNGAKHVSSYVHDLWEDSNGYAFDMDDAALRDEVIDVLLTTPSRASAMEQLREMAARTEEDPSAPRDAEDLSAAEAYDRERNESQADWGVAEQPGPDDVPFSVSGDTVHAPERITPERWNAIIDQLNLAVGAGNVVTDPDAVRAAYDAILARGAKIRRQQVESANERFNEQLEQLEEGTLPSGDKITLGNPSAVLLACGVNNAEITATQRMLKGHIAKHGLSLDDLRNLPMALESPIMVYEWGDKARSTIVITEIPRGNERIAVAIRLKPGRNGIAVNAVASVHGKSVERLLADMNTPLTDFGVENLKWVDKEKVLDWIAAGGSFGPSGINQGLVVATNIVENFENPKIEEENATPSGSDVQFFRTPQGEVYGFTTGGVIYLDSSRMNADTPMHEYTELWAQIVARENPAWWNRAKEIMRRDTGRLGEIWRAVSEDPNYKGLPEDLRASETLSRATGEWFSRQQAGIKDDAGLFAALKRIVREFWRKLKSVFRKWSDKELAAMTADDVMGAPVKDFVEGIDLQKYRDERTLAGVHNISAEKFKKAVKKGGFANPSAAVLDVERQSHEGYGEISLIMPSSLVDSSSGHNVGTYFADAYTPRFPAIERQMSDEGSNAANHDLAKLPKEMQDKMRMALNRWLDGRGADGLEYMFLHEQGEAPQLVNRPRKFSDDIQTAVTDATHGGYSLNGLTPDEADRVVDAYIAAKYGGDRVAYEQEVQNTKETLQPGLTSPRELVRRRTERRLGIIDERGYDPAVINSFLAEILSDVRHGGRVDVDLTVAEAQRIMEDGKLRSDFERWMDSLSERYGINEVIFKGYTSAGDRRYVPATLENISADMREKGRQGVEGLGITFENFAAGLLDKSGDLDKIRSEKERLNSNHEAIDAFRDKWSEVFYDLGEKCQPDASGYDDYGLYRLAEAAQKRDPQAYLQKEYGVELSDEDAARLKEMVHAIRSEMPAMYFETKFERPVYLNEFAGAVVPENTDPEILNSLDEAGVPYRTYGSAEDRPQVIREFTRELGDVRFSRDFTQRRLTSLEKLENRRASLLADRANIANFEDRLAELDAEIEAYKRVDHVAKTYGEHGEVAESDAHLRAVEDAVYDMQREMNFPTPTVVVRNVDEFIARLREMGATDEQLKGISPEHCPEGAQWRGEIIIRGDAVADKVHVRVIYIHEQSHDITEALFTPDELYNAAEEMGADYMNQRLEKRNASYHVDGNSVESMIQGANEMISRGVDLLYRKGLLAEFFATENGSIDPVIMYMEEHGVPSRLKDLIVENLQNIKADQYGTERTRQNIPGEVEIQLDSRLFPARESDGAADGTGEGTGTAGNAVPERIGTGATGTAADARGRIGGRGGDLDRPSFSFGDLGNDAPKLTKQQQLIADLRRAVRESKASARSVAKIVSREVRKVVSRELVETMGKREFDTIIHQIEEASRRQDVEKPLRRIAEVAADLEIKRAQQVVDNLLKLKIQGVSPSGVSIARKVDDRTRRIFEIFRNNLDRPASDVAEELREREDADTLYDIDAVSALESYQDAAQLRREISDIQEEIKSVERRNTDLRNRRIQANKAGNTSEFERLKAEIVRNNERIESLEEERTNTKERIARALKETADLLLGQLDQGQQALREWKQRQEEHKKKIIRDAFLDVDDGSRIPVLARQPGVWEKGYRTVVDFLISPAYSMDYLLKMISVNAPRGEGFTYDRFMRGEHGYVEARGQYYDAYERFKAELNDKAEEIFGKPYPRVLADSNELLDVTFEITNARRGTKDRSVDKESEEQYTLDTYIPTIGEAMYIYMVNKMSDGRVKLQRMRLGESEVARLAEALPPQYLRFADWLQDEFLPGKRKRYNATHLDVFGTQMAEIDHYVPIKVEKSYIRREVDGSEPDPDTLPSAITGSIIKRTRNNLILDLHTNALDLMLEHGQQMEHWNAFTRVVQDMNALLSSTGFRRVLDARNPGLHGRLKVAAQLAADSYRPKSNDVNRAWVALGKLAASSKIAFRVNTAIKQVLSYPAFYGYYAQPGFWGILTKNMSPATWSQNWKWSIENLPTFRERWKGRMAGNEKLAQVTAPALDKWIDTFNKYGMIPNAFVDALTCANGARAVYDFRRGYYIRGGKPEAEAERLARIDAAIAINTTQQSSEGMYLGQMQADRDFWSVSLSTFQNSNFGYLRKEIEGINELFRDAQKEREHRREYYKRQGLSEEEAYDRALKDVVEAKRGALLHIGVFMFVLNLLWELGNNVWKNTFAPETRREIPDDLKKAALIAVVRNTTIGSAVESFANGYDANPSVLLSDLLAFTQKVRRMQQQDDPDAWNETIAYFAVQTLTANGIGIDLESFTNMYQGIAGMIRDGADVEDIMGILNAPRSQARLIAGKPKEDETMEQYQERMVFIERRIVARVEKRHLDKWTRNYAAYKQADVLGMDTERDKAGNIHVPELDRLDSEYGEALKESGVTRSGDLRTGFAWPEDPDRQERWRQRARAAWHIAQAEKELDSVIVFNERYAERMRELMRLKREYIDEVTNNE